MSDPLDYARPGTDAPRPAGAGASRARLGACAVVAVSGAILAGAGAVGTAVRAGAADAGACFGWGTVLLAAGVVGSVVEYLRSWRA